MRSIVDWFIKYPTWANVIKIIVMIFGLIAILNLKSSFFAELESNIISIQVTYPGASPVEIEEGVVLKIEDNLKGIQGIDRYTSKSSENVGSITIEVFRNENIEEVLEDVKNAVNRINSFPVGMEPIVVAKSPALEFAISFGVYGVDDLQTLKNISLEVENDLRNIDGISQISIEGIPEPEIVTYISEEQLRRYNLSFDDVTRALRTANIELTAGSIKTAKEEILIRMEQKKYYAEELQDVVVKSMPDGKLVTINDIGRIENTWAENPEATYINGKRAVTFTVSKILGENILDITDMVRVYVDDFNEAHDVLEAQVLDDFTKALRQRLKTLGENGGVGALLVLLSLALFLNWRIAFWVALSIPFSFLGMGLLAYFFGITINVLSLFACIVVVGILVDDGIVVAEQIYQNYERGKKPFTAAMEGVLEVLPSIFFAVTTTIAAFTPFFFLDGRQGASMKDLAFVVIAALIFSLIEAAIILPAHLSHSKALRQKVSGGSKFRDKINQILLWPRDKVYAPTLKFFLNNKIIAIALVIFLTVMTLSGYRYGVIGATFFPYIDADSFNITVEMPAGTRGNETLKVLDRIEEAAWEVNEEMSAERTDGNPTIIRVVKKLAKADGGDFGRGQAGSSNQGIVQIVLLDGEIRDLESFKVANRIREKVGPVYTSDKIIYGNASIFGKPVSISLVSPNLNDLEEVKEKVKEGLENMPEITNISDNDPKGLREIKLTLKPKAYMLGFNNLEVARQVRQGFFGDEVQRLQRGTDEVKVWVKYTFDDRASLGKFEEIRLKTPNGNEYPLIELVDYEIKRGSIIVNHIDGMREITVDADLVDQNAEVPPVLAKVQNQIVKPLLEQYPSVKTVESGQQRELNKMRRSSSVALPVGFVVMFFLVVLSFRSYLQALVVFSLVPLGFIGASWGHALYGIPFNILSGYGMIALIGIIINNSIVYINTYNRLISNGMGFREAIYEAGLNRFRPILLTTMTTVLGLLPLLSETSIQARFLIPMAISVGYGLLFGSVFVLWFLPVYMALLNRVRVYAKWLWTGTKPSYEEVEPAIKEVRMIKELSSEND